MSRYLAALSLLLVAHLGAAATVPPAFPCERQVYVFGESTVLAKGVREPKRNDFASRMKDFFMRVCGASIQFETIAEVDGRLIDMADAIVDRISRSPRSVAFVHFPFTDIEAGASVDRMLSSYRRILDACTYNGSICILGGQQPVNSFSQETTETQLEVERRASAAFGVNYLPIYRYFQSESKGRRLMLPLDSGDGRLIYDFGHEVLYEVYRKRLLQLTAAQHGAPTGLATKPGAPNG